MFNQELFPSRSSVMQHVYFNCFRQDRAIELYKQLKAKCKSKYFYFCFEELLLSVFCFFDCVLSFLQFVMLRHNTWLCDSVVMTCDSKHFITGVCLFRSWPSTWLQWQLRHGEDHPSNSSEPGQSAEGPVHSSEVKIKIYKIYKNQSSGQEQEKNVSLLRN